MIKPSEISYEKEVKIGSTSDQPQFSDVYALSNTNYKHGDSTVPQELHTCLCFYVRDGSAVCDKESILGPAVVICSCVAKNHRQVAQYTVKICSNTVHVFQTYVPQKIDMEN